MKLLFQGLGIITLLFYSILSANAQAVALRGKVMNNGEGLGAASVIAYGKGSVINGTVTNQDGAFSLTIMYQPDSLKVSMVGYQSKVISDINWLQSSPFMIELSLQPIELSAVEVKSLTAVEIVELAIRHLPVSQPQEDFETSGFYREVIKDRDHYFSIAEALFTVQFFPDKEDFKLKLDKGRTSEEVSYRALFEDFHPGGGPQRVVNNSLLVEIPSFLRLKELKKYEFKRLPVTVFDDRRLYVISFDQKDGLKESLETGKLFIDAEDFALVKYEAANSPKGIRYIKHLSGSDKFFAELLNIDLKRKSWKRTVDFSRLGDKWVLNHAEMEHVITYKQPKKKLDLDLTIAAEILLNPQTSPITRTIPKKEEWQRNNLVKNLPNVFDSSWWGDASIIQPTQKIQDIVKSIAASNGNTPVPEQTGGWLKLNEQGFTYWQHADSLVFIPLQKSRWDNEHNGPLLHEELDGDFSIETKLIVTRAKTANSPPDKGFQQCGIMIRTANNDKENYISLALGTSGNKHSKLVLTKTSNNKSRQVVEKMETLNCWLKLVKKGQLITAYKKLNEKDDWLLIQSYSVEWTAEQFQAGLFGFAWFSGKGPAMYPDIKGIFSQTHIIKQTL